MLFSIRHAKFALNVEETPLFMLRVKENDIALFVDMELTSMKKEKTEMETQ